MELFNATLETLEMTLISLMLSYLLGMPLGILTAETAPNGLYENRIINKICNIIIGIGRAVPFTILMVLVLPFTRFLIGTGIGTTATIVPLTIAAVPFVARTIEQSMLQVDYWVIKAAQIDNTPKIKIIFRVKIGSRLYDIMNSVGLTSIAIISYTCMSGAVGGSGSTMMTCEQLGRKCYTMEYDPKFVDVIVKRWEKLTGQKAVKISCETPQTTIE